ncbi:MAG: universal stress protein [Candidatus Marinimicrobia bacterium]|nr:universal stress protein [Candidatus Neomarinimicrobiota bacterium]
MIKKVIVGLDESNDTKSAISVACRLAKDSDCVVVGVGVVDLPGIESIERGATPGALYFAEEQKNISSRTPLKK